MHTLPSNWNHVLLSEKKHQAKLSESRLQSFARNTATIIPPELALRDFSMLASAFVTLANSLYLCSLSSIPMSE